MRIYLDIDGVLADWTGMMLKRLGLDPLKNFMLKNWPEGKFRLDEVFDIDKELINKIAEDENFWTSLATLPKAHHLYQHCYNLVGKENLFLLSSPGHWSASWTGKKKWVDQNFPLSSKNLILTRHKNLIRAPGILIDDKQATIDLLEEERQKGYRPLRGLLYPQPWNSLKDIPQEEKYDYVLNKLKELMS